MTEEDYMPEFTELTVIEQLEKVVVSASNPFPRDWVVTDDGDKITGITPSDAVRIKTAVMNVMKPADRLEVLKTIQLSEGFKEVLGYVRSL